MKRRELLIRSGWVAAVGLLAACGGGAVAPSAASATAAPTVAATVAPTAAPAAIKVKIGWVSVSAANSAIWSAEDGGYLKKYGLDAEVTSVADSTQAVAAMLSGAIPLNCGISGTAVVASAIGGSDLVIAAATIGTFPNSLYGKASIKDVAALKGGKVGVTRLGTASDTAARLALKSGGLDPTKDVQLVATGGLNETIAALQSGQIDAGALSPPQTLIARGLGFKEIIDVGKLGIEYVYNGVAFSKAFADKNAAAIEATLKALLEGEHRFRTDPEFGRKVIRDRTKTDLAQTNETYDLFASVYLKEPPFATEAAIKTVLEELSASNAKAKTADPKSFIDPSWLKKLDDSGFIKGLKP